MVLFFATKFFSQNVLIKGQAHTSYAKKIIQVSFASDYISNFKQKETQDTIDTDGYFELNFQSDYTQPVFLNIGNVAAQLYVEPNSTYTITIPEIETAYDYKNGAELFVNIGMLNTDSTELNALTFDYQRQYNTFFLQEDNRYLSRAVIFKYADSLEQICFYRYAKIKNTYFKNHVFYAIASINASVSRGENFLINHYILNKPILYRHYEYMNFFNACFTGYLNRIAVRKGQTMYNIINSKVDYKLLDEFMKEDKFLKGDSLRELVMIKNLWEFYFSADFDKDAVKTILGNINANTKNTEHKQITSTMLAHINNLQVGQEAPMFSAVAANKGMASLSAYKGKWIYLNFFSTQNVESLKEMTKIAALKKKYANNVAFVSVCVDDSLKTFINYVKSNPKFDWAIWYNYNSSFTQTAKDKYAVSGTEAYFLISNLGYLAQSPAIKPSKGIEYRFNTLFKIRVRQTKTGIR
ncbi:MAG: redoxin domain-containing protein [Bacteroidetes bacterium]|nr:redoxin domain-containing protein [Bacteroidota bacterium]